MENIEEIKEIFNVQKYVKYNFYGETWSDKDDRINIGLDLEIDYDSSDYGKIIINTNIFIKYNKDSFKREKEIHLQNLFKMDNLKEEYFYLLPIEKQLIDKAISYAKEKIDIYYKTEGENI